MECGGGGRGGVVDVRRRRVGGRGGVQGLRSVGPGGGGNRQVEEEF